MHGQFTRDEIFSQPEVWAEALNTLNSQTDTLRDFYREGQFEAVLLAGCGSMHYLALAAAPLWQELLHIPARGLPASEIWLNPEAFIPKSTRTLLVAVSRSGETTETLRACETFRAKGNGEVLTIACYPDRPLTTVGAVNLIFAGAQERSIAQTRAFSTVYLSTMFLGALWADRADVLAELVRLPSVCRSLLDRYHASLSELGADGSIDRFYFLGSGPRYGLACELSLKMKEMSISHSEPFHFMEFRHGPKAMVTPSTLIVGLVSEANRAHELAVLSDMRSMGARILALDESGGEIAFASGLSEIARNALYLPVGQWLACERARSKGLDPDLPQNLSAVVTLPG